MLFTLVSSLLILIKHGKQISLNSLPRPLWTPTPSFHMIDKVSIISPCIFHRSSSAARRWPSAL
ncbi:hypothetical protein RHMOL_Rhmol01G0260900 [Rhododendron molle]|uniref:Uncharacterized protein n=1 Tax=Rhododendron molle TaxID=49168 RepID=A0ACC0Q708_RHOML|nr:hypothetical protein RHMOL_Rhmol01G0260900 [Rhododendron molle]